MPAGVAALAVVAALLRGRAWPPVSRFVVEGPSMEPAYRSGDRLLVNRLAYLRAAPEAGDVVVLRDPGHRRRLLLKRIAEAPPGAGRADAIYVLGDHPAESRDSRHFGAVPRSLIIGRAWRKY
jgi:nickel-type superoxide dismutase maturation protease